MRVTVGDTAFSKGDLLGYGGDRPRNGSPADFNEEPHVAFLLNRDFRALHIDIVVLQASCSKICRGQVPSAHRLPPFKIDGLHFGEQYKRRREFFASNIISLVAMADRKVGSVIGSIVPSAKYTESYFFSSDPLAGAQNVSADGTTFTVKLSEAITIPIDAVAPEVGIVTAAIWNTSPNIGPALGAGGVDDYKFQYTTSVAPAGTYDVTFPTGQYSLSAISSYLVTALSNNLHPVNLFSGGGQDATGLAYVTILTNGDSIHFEQAETIGNLSRTNCVRHDSSSTRPCQHVSHQRDPNPGWNTNKRVREWVARRDTDHWQAWPHH